LPWVAVVLTAMAALLGGCAALGPDSEGPPDVVLVSIDTLRADHLGAYGYAAAQTPHIDRLAAEGVLFEQVVSPAPLTLPSHATMLSGLIPPRHGVRNNRGYRLPPEVITLAERLEAARYQTAAFVGGFTLAGTNRLDQGFQVYDDDFRPVGGVGWPAPGNGTGREHLDRPADAVVAAAGAWLTRAAAGRPLFLFVHLFDPHEPYVRPVPGATQPSYDGEIAFADRAIGELLARLGQARGDRPRVVVFTSDHGEGLGDHGEETHGLLVYETTLRVPLIIHGAGREVAPRRVADPVGLVDIAPTVLELLGLPALAGADGQSLVSQMRGDAAPARAFYFEGLQSELDWGWAPLRGIRLGALKYIESPEPELYDLAADPREDHTLLPAAADRLPELAARVQAVGPGRHAGALSSEKAMEALAQLGYVAAPPAASRAATPAAPLNPRDAVGHVNRFREVHSMRARGQVREAVELMRALEPVAGSSVYFYSQWGDMAGQVGNWAVAEHAFERVIELDPTVTEAWLNLGLVYAGQGNVQKAVRQYEALLELTPDHPGALINLGWTRQELLHDPAGARPYLQRFLEVAPRDPRAAQVRALLGRASN
jgi:arylsulfatase A-like enzyme